MVDVNDTLTRKVAQLARLELSDQEVQTFTSQLGDILKYVEQLQQVDVQKVEPLTHPLDLATPMRDDQVRPSPIDAAGKPKVLQSAPDVLYDGYKVPPIL
jgi:aspartyl-tRNA(Asn)/glutamyl-tRNA(Gln) amidotransferase subunit C